jgi:hypothetical protein
VAITFDPTNKRIILDSATVTASQIWTAWVDWVVLSDNSKYPPALSQVGGDSLGGGLFIPVYLFLLNGWRVRPMESDHLLIITGNLFVEGGGQPVVNTLGNYNVSTQYTVPIQAQSYSTTGGSNPTPTQIAEAVWAMMLTSGYSANTTVSNTLNNVDSLPTPPTVNEIAQGVWDEVI